jgi:hypothetical protein
MCLFLGLHEGLSRYRRSLQPYKENIQYRYRTSEHKISSLFFVVILSNWFRIPYLDLDLQTQLNPDPKHGM